MSFPITIEFANLVQFNYFQLKTRAQNAVLYALTAKTLARSGKMQKTINKFCMINTKFGRKVANMFMLETK